jgi:hypothetical protein
MSGTFRELSTERCHLAATVRARKRIPMLECQGRAVEIDPQDIEMTEAFDYLSMAISIKDRQLTSLMEGAV